MSLNDPRTVQPPSPEPDFGYGAAVLLRLMADGYRAWAGTNPDLGPWEERDAFMLSRGVLFRGRHSGLRETPALELCIELPLLDPPRRAVEVYPRAELDLISPPEAVEVVKALFQRAAAGNDGQPLWPPSVRPYALLPETPVPAGTRVQVRFRGPYQYALPYQGRQGTVVGAVDPATVEHPRGWQRYPPAYLLLVDLDRRVYQWRRYRRNPVKERQTVVFADWELDIVEERASGEQHS